MVAQDETKNAVSEVTAIVKNGLAERFSSPFLMAFTIPWLIINYKVLVIIFSGASLEEKIRFLDQYFTSPVGISVSYDWPHIYLAPFLAALLFLFGVPVINILIDHYRRKIKIFSYRLQKLRLHTFEELEEARAEQSEIIQQLRVMNERLETSNANIRRKNDMIIADVKKAEDEENRNVKMQLTPDMKKAFMYLGISKFRVTVAEDMFKSETGFESPKFEQIIDDLYSIGLINKVHNNQTGQTHYSLIKSGDRLFNYISDTENP